MTNTIERALEKQRQMALDKEVVDDQISSQPVIQPATRAELAAASQQPVMATPSPQSTSEHEAYADKKSAEEVLIDPELLEELGMVSPTENFSQIKEEYRYIKRPLLNNAIGTGAQGLNKANLILVSSTHPGEGKTFTAINLAMSMVQEQDKTVLLVDADVINPSICRRLKIDEHPGLMDYLLGEVSVQDIILSTNIPNLKLVTAGTRHHHSNEMLASLKMKQFMEELSTRYSDRIVVFDSAPILGASETNVLAQMTGQAVIVVEEESTTHGQLDRALSVLNPKIAVGLVLNKSKSSRREYYGYYYANDK